MSCNYTENTYTNKKSMVLQGRCWIINSFRIIKGTLKVKHLPKTVLPAKLPLLANQLEFIPNTYHVNTGFINFGDTL